MSHTRVPIRAERTRKLRGFLSAVFLLLLFNAACSHRGAPTTDVAADPAAAWIRGHAHEVALEADGFADLEFLRPLLEGKRVVQLGENAHGMREYNLVKARIVRFLHQELGYEVLALESPVYQCYDAGLMAATEPAVRTLTNCAYGTWHTREVLPLFEYLRASHGGTRPLRLAGFDVQPIGRNKADRPDFLARIIAPVDSSYAREVFQLDSTFLVVYARGSRERRAFFRSDEGQRMAERYDRLEEFLAQHRGAVGRPSTADAHAAAIAQRTAASMAWYIRQQSAPTTREYVERRDEGMAENLAFLLDTLYSDRKIIVWGHNFHLRHDNLSIAPDSAMFPNVAARTMGSWIRERYGDSVYTIGLYAFRGSAADNGGEIYEIAAAEPGSLEALLQQAGAPALFVDLSRAPRVPGTSWMDEPITARYNGTTPLAMVLRHQYDGILLVDSVTPRAMLQ